MRLLWKALLAVSLFGALVGCRHTAGVCDCDCGCDGGCATGSCGCGGGDILNAAPAPSSFKVDTAPHALPAGAPTVAPH